MGAAVELDGVVKRFDEIEALHGVSASIESGRLTGLVGPDGAGKTTLLRMMAALMKPSEGSIRIDGLDVSTEQEAIHKIAGYMPQRFGLYEDLTVMENLELYADLRSLDRVDRSGTFEQLLQFTQMSCRTCR